ncbi:MAG: hypothetical protein JSS76_01375 [Bacteroidetes bacterium]|nr:hypothetical protein [Bacteroidota bacterium]MBS1683374.1 hypothetical protein [Bacteroidota bacterium]
MTGRYRYRSYGGLWVLIILMAGSTVSCRYFKKSSPNQGEIVLARANDDYLYLSDVTGMTRNMSPKDSADFVVKYSESWVRRKLLLKKAEENVPADELGIDKKVEDYRQSLLLYEYEKELINQKLDKSVTDAEVQAFYDQNKEKFTLESDIYDLQYVEIPTDAPDLDKMRPTILNPRTDDDINKREGYCKAYAQSYSFADSNWLSAAAVMKRFPITPDELKKIGAAGRFTELKKGPDSYFIYIRTVRHQGEPSPLEYIRTQIREIVMNKKKVVLIQKIYDGIYADAQKSGKSEVLVRKAAQ